MGNNHINNSDIVKHSSAISLTVLIGKVFGFLKQSVIAWAFGANSITDVYFAADGYTSLFGQILGSSVGPTVLTGYLKLSQKGKEEKARKIIQESFTFFFILGLLLVGINISLASNICNIIGISYSFVQKQELNFFLIALCPVMLLTSITGVAQGYLDANRQFLPAKLCSLFFSVSIIVSVLLFKSSYGLKSLLYGFLFGYVAHTLFMAYLVIPKIGLDFSNPFHDFEFRKMIGKFVPLIIGNSIVDLGLLTNKIVASSLAAGSVSVLFYGQVVSNDLVSSVFVTSVGTVLLTSLTKKVSAGIKKCEIANELQYIMCIMSVLTGLLTALYLVEGMDLIRLFFERGSFDTNNTKLVYSISAFYAVGFVFMAIREVLIKAHYAYQDTISPMINSVIGVVINFSGCILLSKFMGISGIAFASSLSMALVVIISLFTIKKHVGKVPINNNTIIDFLKIVISIIVVVLMGDFMHKNLIEWHYIFRMIFVSGFTMVAYILLLMILQEKVIKDMLKKVKRISNL